MAETIAFGASAPGLPPVAAAGAPAMTPGLRLHLAALRLAGRLAMLLDEVSTGRQELAFLHSLAKMAGTGGTDGSVLDLPAAGVADPVDRVVARLGLDPLDLDLLVLAALPGEQEGLAAIARTLHPEHRPAVTGGLAASLAEAGLIGALTAGTPVSRREAVRERLTSGVLGRSGLVRLDRDVPFAEAAVIPGPAIWGALRGEDLWPPGCHPQELPVTTAGLGPWAGTSPALAAMEAFRRLEPVIVVVTSEARPAAAAARVAALAQLAGRPVRVVRHAPARPGWMAMVTLHALARGVIPVVIPDCADDLAGDPGAVPWPITLCLGETDRIRSWPRPLIEIPVPPLDLADRRAAAESFFPGFTPRARPTGSAATEPMDLAEAATNLQAISRLTGRPSRGEDAESLLDRLSAEPPTGTVLVHPMAAFKDLVLSGEAMSQLREAAARLEHREIVLGTWGFLAGRPGRQGVRLLFHGPPGTGKTLAAEVMAGALTRDLLVVDLSRIISKWMGETEKHLAEAFETAERTGSALFFDEADALFGRRTEVGDARDRYANLETAYLLSRIERFEGLVILATNLRHNLDSAFARRLDFIIGFDPPDAGQRAQLWRRLLPPRAPLDPGVDVGQLAARYAIPGGMIRNAAVSAAYLAAANGGVIRTSHLIHAVRREYAKAGQHFPGEPQRSSS